MTVLLRVLLAAGALLTCLWVAARVYKAQARVRDMVFWLATALLLVLLSLFPQVAIWFSGLLGIESPANFVFLCVIFLLLTRVFDLTLRLSRAERQLEVLAGEMAIHEKKHP